MKIECLTTFLDGKNRYEKGDIRVVTDEDGARFCAAGWCRDVGGEVATGDDSGGNIDLDVQNATSGHTSNVGA